MAFKPVINDTRVGVQTVHAYACASFSMLGVWNFLLSGVGCVQNGTLVSCHPMSSTRKTMMLGFCGTSAALAEIPHDCETTNARVPMIGSRDDLIFMYFLSGCTSD